MLNSSIFAGNADLENVEAGGRTITILALMCCNSPYQIRMQHMLKVPGANYGNPS